jgi:hypothetical protein
LRGFALYVLILGFGLCVEVLLPARMSGVVDAAEIRPSLVAAFLLVLLVDRPGFRSPFRSRCVLHQRLLS